MNLKDITKEIDSIVNDLKAGQDKTDFPVERENARKRLLEIRKLLQKDFTAWQHNQSILGSHRWEGLKQASQITETQAGKVKKLLSDVNSALDYCHRIKKNAEQAAKTTKTQGHMIASDITSQTIALIDVERYEITTDHGALIEYPKPDLGTPTYQRNCDIAEKIRIGLKSSMPGKGGNYQITMPKCYSDFCGGKF